MPKPLVIDELWAVVELPLGLGCSLGPRADALASTTERRSRLSYSCSRAAYPGRCCSTRWDAAPHDLLETPERVARSGCVA
jgi:hypothetical protein